jgi:excisionase family DNA binding protein
MDKNMALFPIGMKDLHQSIAEIVRAEFEKNAKAQSQTLKFLTSKEVCEILGITSRTLQNYRDDKKIPYAQTGTKIYYKACDIEAFVEKYYIKAP